MSIQEGQEGPFLKKESVLKLGLFVFCYSGFESVGRKSICGSATSQQQQQQQQRRQHERQQQQQQDADERRRKKVPSIHQLVLASDALKE